MRKINKQLINRLGEALEFLDFVYMRNAFQFGILQSHRIKLFNAQLNLEMDIILGKLSTQIFNSGDINEKVSNLKFYFGRSLFL